ncbi:MAG: hypothetical protein HY952_02760 [Elusimicrobia bacterium]|nr:hypothetical protein [Elusimicrobiota bacterium]
MKKQVAFMFAALMCVSAAVRAAEVDFDGNKAGGLDTAIGILDIVSDLAGGGHQPPPPGQFPQHPGQPGHPGGHPGYPPPPPPVHPGQPGGHPGYPPPPPPHYPPVPPPYNPGWDHPNQPSSQYHFGGYRESCRTMEFNAQSPLSQTMDMIMEEYGQECMTYDHGFQGPCRPATNYHKRKVTVNIGPRQLEAWETERLEVCMRAPKSVDVNLNGMLYEYAVSSQNDDGLFRRSTIFTMTPGRKKPSQPSGKELEMTYAGITTSGDVRIILKDNRADYFRGEKITITADGMNIPDIGPNTPVDQVLNSFVKFNVTQAYDVAGSYELKLMDAPKPGKYVVTVKFFRSGPLSSGTEASNIETFELK